MKIPFDNPLQESLKTKRKELEDIKVRTTESEAKVAELTVRLENQVSEIWQI